MNNDQTLSPGPSTHGPGALRWGIKSSFVKYVESAPDGTRTASGVVEIPGETGPVFEFPLTATSTGPDGTLTLRFSGSVQFQAHHGMLDVHLSSPTVIVKDGRAEVSVLDMSPSGAGHAVRIARFESDIPTTADARVSARSSEVLLTTQGSQLLGDVYPARTVLEPLTLDVSFQDDIQ